MYIYIYENPFCGIETKKLRKLKEVMSKWNKTEILL